MFGIIAILRGTSFFGSFALHHCGGELSDSCSSNPLTLILKITVQRNRGFYIMMLRVGLRQGGSFVRALPTPGP